MEYHIYAKLLYICETHQSDLALYLSEQSDPFFCSLKIESLHACYKFLYSASSFFVVLQSNIKSQGQQVLLNSVPNSIFGVLQDFQAKSHKFKHHTHIGIGFSSGASILAALADICKTIQAYCFNPIGLGKATPGPEFFSQYQIPISNSSITIIQTENDRYSNNFKFIDAKEFIKVPATGFGLLNFFTDSEVSISNISSIFPTISQISFSPSTGFLLVESKEELSNYFIEGDIATIFYMVYTYPKEFFFTLVPSDKNDPSGPFQRKVFGPEELEGTSIGDYLWKADWILKQLDLGLFYDDVTQQMVPIKSEIPWFKSGFDFYSEESQERSFVRLWFVTEKVNFAYVNSEKGITVCPGEVKIKVEARKLQANADTEFGFSDTAENHTAYKFSKYLTENFEKIAEIIPEIQRLKQIGMLISLAEFFRDTLKIPKEFLNLPMLKERITKVKDEYPRGEVPRLARKESRVEGEYVVTLNLTGGISMLSQKSEPVYKPELIDYLDRSSEVLTPFLLTHFDYMKKLLEYNRENDTETSESTQTAISLFTPSSCSEEHCNNIVIFNTAFVDLENGDAVYDEISPYSYQGKIYCKDHHPFKCFRQQCKTKIIMPGQSYAQLKFGKFHAECLVCENCEKPVTNKFVFQEGFLHTECIEKYNEKTKKKQEDEEYQRELELKLNRDKLRKIKNTEKSNELIAKDIIKTTEGMHEKERAIGRTENKLIQSPKAEEKGPEVTAKIMKESDPKSKPNTSINQIVPSKNQISLPKPVLAKEEKKINDKPANEFNLRRKVPVSESNQRAKPDFNIKKKK